MIPVTDVLGWLTVHPAWALALVAVVYAAVQFRGQLAATIRSRPRSVAWLLVYVGAFIAGRIAADRIGSLSVSGLADTLGGLVGVVP